MPILLCIFCGFSLLGLITFVLSICFPGKIHTHPEGYNHKGGEQSEPNEGESVTDLIEEHYYASYKQNQFSNN